MDAKTETPIPAAQMARDNPVRIPHESAAYRAARTALLAEEIELRRHTERVAEMRRALPDGPPVLGDYRFMGEDGRETDLAGLFGDRETLVVYTYMFGPQRARPCPMCTTFLDAWESNAAEIGQHVAMAVVARSPIEKLKAFKQERGWKRLRLHQDLNDNYVRDYVGLPADGSDEAGIHVFTRRDGSIRHFWSDEFAPGAADPGQDPRGTIESPVWAVLDRTPEGRRPDWYPKLSY
jgi:predicted dithiol-disulfide oxidoreductase (DUF899 family)